MRFIKIEGFLESKRNEHLFLFTACIAALIYRGWPLMKSVAGGVPEFSHVSYDGVYYVQIARNIVSGDGLGWEAMLFPVLQPILIACASVVTGIENYQFLSVLVSLAASIGMMVPLYLLARELAGKKAAAAAVLFVITYPHLNSIALGDTTESLYTSLLVLSLYCAFKGGELFSLGWLFATGLSFGVTYLARPEGQIVFGPVLLILCGRFYQGGKKSLVPKVVAIMVAGFLIAALPYMVFLTKSYGRFVASPKLAYESIAMRGKVYQEPFSMTEIDGITAKGNLAWMENGGAGKVLEYVKGHPAKFTRIYLENLWSEMPWNVRNSSHLQGYPPVYPIYLWGFATLGGIMLVMSRGQAWKALLIWVPFLNLFVYPVFTAGFWIYHVPYVPSLVVFATAFLAYASWKIKEVTGKAVPLLMICVLLWTLYSLHTVKSSKPLSVKVISEKTTLANEAYKAGQWSRRNLGTDRACMMEWSRLVYYVGGRWVYMPAAVPEQCVEYAKNHGAQFIIEELAGQRFFEGS
ncbi:MAG TPA: glycosyltransferase family 39 protein, partial [Nitrospirota bacterium]